jgi:hypothetical protein
MPQHVDLKIFPKTPMDIIEAAAKVDNWPAPTSIQLAACQALLKVVWKVQSNQAITTQPVYSVNNGAKTDTKIDDVNVNTVCGAYIQNDGTNNKQTWRMVTGNAGKQGAAVCEQTQ